MVKTAKRVNSRLAVRLHGHCKGRGIMTKCVPNTRPGKRLGRSNPTTMISMAGTRVVRSIMGRCGVSAVCGLTTLLSIMTRSGPGLT